jgi:hypothetical protein
MYDLKKKKEEKRLRENICLSVSFDAKSFLLIFYAKPLHHFKCGSFPLCWKYEIKLIVQAELELDIYQN